jgi:hypothetical protein
MRKAFGFLFGNWFARAYLLLVAIFAVLTARVPTTAGICQSEVQQQVVAQPSYAAQYGRYQGRGRFPDVVETRVLTSTNLLHVHDGNDRHRP